MTASTLHDRNVGFFRLFGLLAPFASGQDQLTPSTIRIPMVAILGPELSRRRELLGLTITAVAAVLAVVVPVAYLLAVLAACGTMAGLAPSGRRAVAALAVWIPVSTAVVLGGLPLS